MVLDEPAQMLPVGFTVVVTVGIVDDTVIVLVAVPVQPTDVPVIV